MSAVACVLLAVLAAQAMGVENIGGSWNSYRGNAQNTKYIPVRLGYYTGLNRSFSANQLGYGPQHIVALSNGFGAVPTYGTIHKLNLTATDTKNITVGSLALSGANEVHHSILYECGNNGHVFGTFVGDMGGEKRNLYVVNMTGTMALLNTIPLRNNLTSYSIAGSATCNVFVSQCTPSSRKGHNSCDLTVYEVTTGAQVLRMGTLVGGDARIVDMAVSDTGAAAYLAGSVTGIASITGISVALGTTLFFSSWSTEQFGGSTHLVYHAPSNSVVVNWFLGGIVVLDAASGKTRWTQRDTTYDAVMSPAVDNDSIYLPVNLTWVTRIRLSDGAATMRYGPNKYANDIIVFDDAVVVQQSQAGQVAVQVHAKHTGALVETIKTPHGYFNKKLGFAAGWLWDWSGATGGPVKMFQFY